MSLDPVTITHHAACRYCERVDPRLTPVEAITAMRQHMPALRVAVEFGCRIVKLGSGARLLLRGGDVVTVLSASQFPPRPGDD